MWLVFSLQLEMLRVASTDVLLLHLCGFYSLILFNSSYKLCPRIKEILNIYSLADIYLY